MTNKIETTVGLLVEENRRKGFLTYQDMAKLMEDQFLPPDKMDQVFVGLEDAGVNVGIGVASGADAVFIGKNLNVEDSRKVPLVTTRDIRSGRVE